MSGTTFPIVLSQAHGFLSICNPNMLRGKQLDYSRLYGLWWPQVFDTMSANFKGVCSGVQLLNPHVRFLLCPCVPLLPRRRPNPSAFMYLHEKF